jgi:hypothetical protein
MTKPAPKEGARAWSDPVDQKTADEKVRESCRKATEAYLAALKRAGHIREANE